MCEILPRSAFIHIPKTGGVTVREILRQSGLSLGRVYANTPKESTEGICPSWHCVPESNEVYESRPHKFCFIRHPITWYQSHWSFRQATDTWNEYNHLDLACRSDGFQEFIDNVFETFPEGYLNWLYGFYSRDTTLIGTMENLFPDLLLILMQTGDYWLAKYLKYVEPQNATPDKSRAIYRPDQIERMFEFEEAVIERFYENTKPVHYMQFAS